MQEGDRESEFHCTVRDTGIMHDIATTHGTCGEMSDSADSVDSASTIEQYWQKDVAPSLHDFLRLS